MVRKLKPVSLVRDTRLFVFLIPLLQLHLKIIVEPCGNLAVETTSRMTVRNIGGGHKRRYRIIDFKRDKDGIAAVVNSIQCYPTARQHCSSRV